MKETVAIKIISDLSKFKHMGELRRHRFIGYK